MMFLELCYPEHDGQIVRMIILINNNHNTLSTGSYMEAMSSAKGEVSTEEALKVLYDHGYAIRKEVTGPAHVVRRIASISATSPTSNRGAGTLDRHRLGIFETDSRTCYAGRLGSHMGKTWPRSKTTIDLQLGNVDSDGQIE